jgi:[protein-PII] uridylyltransferase
MSTASFRQNPQAQTTWNRLFARGVEGRRMVLLALFTAIDIRATNPEAWTPWKAQLLYNLVENLRSPEAKSFNAHLGFAKKKKLEGAADWLLVMDPLLLQMISPSVLIEDLKEAARSKGDLPVKVITKDKKIWVRFHRKVDKPGLFKGFVQRLFGLGLNIQLSSVQTLPNIGVYDWFCLKTEKPARQISKWLSLENSTQTPPPEAHFQSIDLMSQDDEEWILSFKGKDQRGLLFAAARAISDENLSLRWARAHTWGNQVEDVFSVRPFGEVEKLLERLKSRLVT